MCCYMRFGQIFEVDYFEKVQNLAYTQLLYSSLFFITNVELAREIWN